MNKEYFFTKQNAHAIGYLTSDGFVVRAGSTAVRDGSPNVKRDRPLRDKLVKDGILVTTADPALYRFTRDHTFSSPSAAAGVVKDGNSSGTNDWRDVVSGNKMSAATA
jgi:hypothetical protein